MAMTHALSTGGGFSSRTRAKARTDYLGIGNTARVIGWYHSHPHITVLPSHVDLRTQQSFQMLDPGNEIDQRLSPGIEEAMHLSSLDMSSGDFSREEIPIQVVPVSTFNLANPPPDPLLSLQQTVFNEEKAAFEKAMHQSKQGQRIHPLAASHHCVTHQASLLKLMELWYSQFFCFLSHSSFGFFL
ncbi:lys-63-specific deubiquitinase BRCC36-like [Selaginella moellendorffii]|uniref:lys-63-specific deubiquitinase BRCC36-like n=1 Tax=Selaginella moellendorffii TaxID=88036 RepID=UPI000D1C9CCD|nr:lys-63-specific deubiquitinase BRCC36-like [Selaginella moellendorffii]|eukprot:XP_024543359.1 lys-63-specific deubiquitinase BRCC36-like [Selaginella moellendorffii]